MATGVGFSFDTSFLQNLEKADKKMEALMDKSNSLGSSVAAAFQKMTNSGVIPFVNELESKLQSLNSIKMSIGDNAKGQLKTLKESTSSAIDEINKLLNTLYKSQGYKLEVEVALEQATDKERYELWLMQKHSEVKEHKRIEEEKVQATTDAINRQNEAIAAAERKKEIGKAAEKAVEKEIEKETSEYLKGLDKQIQARQEQLQREENVKNERIRIAQAAEKAVEKEIEKEKNAHLKALSEQIKEYQEYQQRMQALEQARLRQQSANRRAEYNLAMAGDGNLRTKNGIASSADNALRYAERIYSDRGLRSVNNMQKAIQKMQQAQNRLNLNTEEGKKKYDQLSQRIKTVQNDINRATNASEEFNKKQKGVLDTAGQLKRALAAAFSVSAIKGYVNKLMQIRGEFELQQRSLQVLLQNKDEAKALWDKTVALAVKSPYTTKQLVTATKQLAAYRVESEKLYETNKMLADVSIGLGVDMNRLILAFGQVKAANFLRGTELRQFSEAGVNMLDELAKRFTALEGRAVSVGEVFERVSKRMVSFKDVEAVFKTITSEGGTFYQMQEKQSETLKGMMLNLKDSFELMLNDIGRESEGRLKGFVSTMRFLVDNLRELAFILEKVVNSYASFKVVNATYVLGMKKASEATLWFNKGLKDKVGSVLSDIQAMTWQEAKIMGVTRAQYAAGKATMYLQGAIRGLWAAIKMAIPFALVGIALELWRVLTKTSREAERLRKELNNIVSGDIANLDKTIDRYTNLATRLDKVNKGSDAHREIISKLNSEYGEYLNFVVTEETTMQNLADAYEDVVKVMKEKQALASFEKGMNAISESYGNALTEAKEDFYDLFEGASIKSKTNKFKFLVPTEKEIDDIYAIIQQRTKELDADQFDSLKEQSDLIQDIVSKYYGDEFSLSRDFYQSIELLDILVKRKKQEKELQEEINVIYKEALHSREAQLELEKLQNKYAEKRRKIEGEFSGYEKEKALAELADEQELAVIDLKLRFNLIEEPEATKQKDAIINWAKGTIADINNRLKNELSSIFSEEELSKVLFTRHIKDSKTINDYLKDITNNWKQQNDIIAEQISLKSELGSLDEANENILQTALRKEELYRKTAELLGVELKYTERLSEETRNAINAILPEEYQISLEQAYGGIDKIIADLKKEEAQHLNIIEQINERKKEGLPFNEQELKDAEDAYWWTKKRLDLIDPKTKTPIVESKVNTINAKLEEKYQIDAVDRTKDEVTLLSEANSEKEKAIAYEKMLNAQKEQGHNITKEELDAAKKDVEQYTLLWKLLGGTEKETTDGTGRSNSLYDERIKVIDDLNKKYRELNKTLDKSTSLQGAFDAYIDAFADAYKGISWIPKNVRQMPAEEFVEKVLNFPSEDALVEFLDRLAKEPMKTFEKIKVELAKGEYVMDMRVEVHKERDQQFADQIEQMFSGYELSLELEKLNIPADAAKSLFGIDKIDLSDIRKEIETELLVARASGGREDFIKEREKELKKVGELELKTQEERLKKYVQYSRKAISKKAEIKMEELNHLAEIEKAFEIKETDTDAQKATKESAKKAARVKVIKDAMEQLKTEDWESFRKSETFVSLFNDLEMASDKAINFAIDQLKKFKEQWKNMPLDIMKQVVELQSKLETEASSRMNPFKKGNDLEKAIKNYGAQLGWFTLEDAQRGGLEAEVNLQLVDDYISKLETVNNLRLEGRSNEEIMILLGEEYGEQIKTNATEFEQIISNQQGLRQLFKQQINDANKITTAATNTKKALEAQSKAWNDINSMANDLYDSFKDLAKNGAALFGEELDGVGVIFADMGMNMASTVMQTLSLKASLDAAAEGATGFGAAMNTAMGVIGWIVMGVQLLSQAIKAIVEAHDKNIQKKLDAELETVQTLEKEYEKFEKAMESAYSIDYIKQHNQDVMDTLDRQIEARRRMIALEESKKKSDKEAITGWKDEIDDLLEKRDEAEKEYLQKLGGIGRKDYYKDAAQGFVDAWLDAFYETGDGLMALEEEFDEVMKNLVKKQVLHRVAGAILEPLFTNIDTAVGNDGVFDEKEFADTMKLAKRIFPEFNEKMKQAIEEMGMTDWAGKNAELGSLSGSISNISEETADVLAGYLNSIRFFVADSNTQLKALVTAQGLDTDTPNPMLSQLLVIAEQTRAIRDLFDSVVVGGHKMGRSGIKVFID